LVASPDAAQGSVLLHADARMYIGHLHASQRAELPLDAARKAYVHLMAGDCRSTGSGWKPATPCWSKVKASSVFRTVKQPR